jgi:hypothetical protein
MLKKAVTPGSFLKNYLFTLLIVFLPLFMFGVFGPSEIFFGNYSEFGFIYREFGWKFLGISVVLALFIALILQIVPKFPRTLILSVLWGFTIAGYIQTMFLNKNLDQIGVTAEGYIPDADRVIKNAVFWGAAIAITFVITFVCKKKWSKVIQLTTTVLLLVQLVAYGSLFLTTDDGAFHYAENELCLNMEQQFTISSNENIIVLLFDNLPNEWFEEARATYPDITKGLEDFTYYNNADCNYYGTYPSFIHILTGNPLDLSLSVNDYFKQSWDNEKTNAYFNILHSHNYKMNVFSYLSEVMTGGNSLEIAEGKVDNIIEKDDAREIDKPLLYKTMLKMSLYRYMPEYFKPKFDVQNEQYASIVSYPNNTMQYSNPNFYNTMMEKGLTIDDSSNYFVVNHLNGGHEFINDANCQYAQDPDRDDTIKGIFLLAAEYINQIKESGSYDDSTIIIMTDHGTGRNAQPIFFMKEPHETHDVMQENNAPITYEELMPTIVELLGEDYSVFGQSFHEFKQDEVRHRVFYDRTYDTEYPDVKRYDGMQGGANIYYKYEYDGNLGAIQYQYDNELHEIFPMVDSYY